MVALVAALREELAATREELAAARAEIGELKARLGQNSQNSSKPPSSDPPGTRPPKSERRKRRKRGGQPGHVARFAADPDHVDKVKQYRPTTCEHCRADLAKSEPTGSVINHYVYELPEIRPIVTDHQCLDVQCSTCGLVTSAKLPPGVPTGHYGPSVEAMTALLRGELKQSMRQTSGRSSRALLISGSAAASGIA